MSLESAGLTHHEQNWLLSLFSTVFTIVIRSSQVRFLFFCSTVGPPLKLKAAIPSFSLHVFLFFLTSVLKV